MMLNQWILSQDLVKEYQRYEALIKQDEKLKQQEALLKQLQQQIVNQKHYQDDCDELILRYQKEKQSFDENPMVHNYLMLKQELNDFLNEIQHIINEQLQKKVDE